MLKNGRSGLCQTVYSMLEYHGGTKTGRGQSLNLACLKLKRIQFAYNFEYLRMAQI